MFDYILLSGDLICLVRTLVKNAYRKINFLIFQLKHVVGTNRLNETVLLSTPNHMLKQMGKKIFSFTLKNFVYLNM